MSAKDEKTSPRLGRRMQKKAAELMAHSERNATGGRHDLAYVYANETRQLFEEDTADSVLQRAAEHAVRSALYKLMPMKRILDRVDGLLLEARGCIEHENYEGAVRLSSKAYTLQPIKTPAPLLLRGDALQKMNCLALAYVDLNEASLLMRGGDPNVTVLKRGCRSALDGYRLRVYDDEKYEQAEDGYEQQRGSSKSALGYHPDWPSRVEVASLQVEWNPEVSREPYCILAKMDGSFVQPAVRFNDLPTFFANHTGANSSLANLQLSFYPGSAAAGMPKESHLRTLIAIAESCEKSVNRRGTSPFAAMDCVRLDGANLHNITATTLEQLFARVLIAKHYQLKELVRLPIGVQPAEFLLYPSLLASHSIQITPLALHHPPGTVSPELQEQVFGTCELVKFSSEAVVAHLKGRRGGGDAVNRLPPLFHITEAYLPEGVVALVDAIKRDFHADKAPTARYPFAVTISFHERATFEKRRYGLWIKSTSPERLQILELHQQMPGFDKYQIVVTRSG